MQCIVVNVTNRIYEKHGYEKFYNGPEDREAIAECAFALYREYDAIKQTLDAVATPSAPKRARI